MRMHRTFRLMRDRGAGHVAATAARRPPSIGTIHRPVDQPLDFPAGKSVLGEGGAPLPTVKQETQMTKSIKRKGASASKAKVRSKPARAPAAAAAPRPGSKIEAAIELLRRPAGASTQELMLANGWLAHSTRAVMTGLRKRGYTVETIRGEGTGTSYRIT
jgi:hypothetical protein